MVSRYRSRVVISVTVPRSLGDEVDRLIKSGSFRTKTEFVRCAIKFFLDAIRSNKLDQEILNKYKYIDVESLRNELKECKERLEFYERILGNLNAKNLIRVLEKHRYLTILYCSNCGKVLGIYSQTPYDLYGGNLKSPCCNSNIEFVKIDLCSKTLKKSTWKLKIV